MCIDKERESKRDREREKKRAYAFHWCSVLHTYLVRRASSSINSVVVAVVAVVVASCVRMSI